MTRPGGRGCAAEPQPCQWLCRPIVANRPRKTLDQLLAVGLHPLQLAR
jgi:hypothetical protein